MRMLIGASIAILAAGCGEPPAPTTDAAPATTPSISAPVSVATPSDPDTPLHNEWIADIRSDQAWLHYGYRNSGVIGLTMTCATAPA